MTIVWVSQGWIFTKPEGVGSESTRSHQHSNRFWSASRKPAVNVCLDDCARLCISCFECTVCVKHFLLILPFLFRFVFFVVSFGIDNPQRIIQQTKSHKLWAKSNACMCVCIRDGFVFVLFFSSTLVLFFNLLFGPAVHVFLFCFF